MSDSTPHSSASSPPVSHTEDATQSLGEAAKSEEDLPTDTSPEEMLTGWTGGLASVWRVGLATLALTLGVEALVGRMTGAWWPSPIPVLALPAAVTWCGLALALAAGLTTRPITLPLALCVLAGGEPAIAGRGHAALIVLLVLAGAMPPAPYGSWPARGRADPGGGWRMPANVRGLTWLALSLSWIHAAWSLLEAPGFGQGGAIAALAGYLRGSVGVVAIWPAAVEIFVFTVAAAFVPMSLGARTRPLVWTLGLLTQLVLAPAIGAPGYSAALVLLHALAFDPLWVSGAGRAVRVVYYDGNCGLCHRATRFLLAEDRFESLRFAALQGDTFSTSVPSSTTLPDSVIVQLEDGTLLWKTAATRHLLSRLGGGWRVMGWALRLVPLPVADLIYDFIARVRHRIFTRPKDVCPLLPPALRRRFLP